MVFRVMIAALLLTVSMSGFGCASQVILNDRQPTPEPQREETPELLVDDFTERLKGVQTGGFDYIYAFRRKDGEIMSAEDKKFVKDNAPWGTNQWVLTSDKKVVIAGSNFMFTDENLTALKKRFNVEDYSNIIQESNRPANTK